MPPRKSTPPPRPLPHPQSRLHPRLILRLRWPLPALLGWALGWAVFIGAARLTLPPWAGLIAASLAPLLLAWGVQGAWRRALVALGFPLSALLLGAGGTLPAWGWLVPLVLLLAVYPLSAWRDAPLFPTPAGALDLLRERIELPPRPRLLDAGCGLGHGLAALRSAWPQARLEGVERSLPLALACRLRCPWAAVRRGDMWAGSWADLDLVYLFQRPETMARAWDKACAEMAPGAWFVSLEFQVPGVRAAHNPQPDNHRPVWAYRIPGVRDALKPQPRAGDADKTDEPDRLDKQPLTGPAPSTD